MTDNQPPEEWRDVPGYEGRYQVSNIGRVRSWVNNVGNRRKEPKALRLNTRRGYATIWLSWFGQGKRYLVHRLVASAFMEKPRPDQQINHINGIKNDNTVGNLEWVTASENVQHAVAVLGAQSWQQGENHPRAKLTYAQVDEIRLALLRGESGAEIARRYGVHKDTISYIRRGKSWGVMPLPRADRGENHPKAKLTDAQVEEIRAAIAGGARNRDLAKQYGTNKNTIAAIKAGRNRTQELRDGMDEDAYMRSWH